jgi:hypothetical protein
MADRAGGFTYNDVLTTCALEAFRLWNAGRNPRGGGRRVGLWIPINIRQEPLEGFGNGTSRIRVYSRYASSSEFHEKCRVVRKQVDWSREHGEWAVPALEPLMRLPMPLLRPLLRTYFHRPWVDMATGAFSHVQRSPLDTASFQHVTAVETVGVLDPRHPVALYGMTRGGTTHLTFVYDPARIDGSSVAELKSLYQEQLALARSGGAP